MTDTLDLVYAGDLEPTEVWERLKTGPAAVLVDVRTQAEWYFIGVPDLSDLGQEVVFVEWVDYPGKNVNSGFVEALAAQLSARGLGADTPIYMLCRSGVRSQFSAAAMTEAGYSQSYNILSGFEGKLNDEGQRGKLSGWKVAGLAWRQT